MSTPTPWRCSSCNRSGVTFSDESVMESHAVHVGVSPRCEGGAPLVESVKPSKPKRRLADVIVVDPVPDATPRSIGVTDAPLPEDDYAPVVWVNPEVAREAVTDTVKTLFP